MMKFGARRGLAEMMNVFQSARDRGEKIFIPFGQLFFSRDFDTFKHCSHFAKRPAEYGPERVTGEHLHDRGLPSLGFKKILFFWQ